MNPEEPCVQSMLPVRLPIALTVPSEKLYAEKAVSCSKNHTYHSSSPHIHKDQPDQKRALITTVRQAGVVKNSGDKYTFTTLLSLLSVFVPD